MTSIALILPPIALILLTLILLALPSIALILVTILVPVLIVLPLALPLVLVAALVPVWILLASRLPPIGWSVDLISLSIGTRATLLKWWPALALSSTPIVVGVGATSSTVLRRALSTRAIGSRLTTASTSLPISAVAPAVAPAAIIAFSPASASAIPIFAITALVLSFLPALCRQGPSKDSHTPGRHESRPRWRAPGDRTTADADRSSIP